MRKTFLVLVCLGTLAGCSESAEENAPASSEEDLTRSKLAGAFSGYASDKTEGDVFELNLKPDNTFTMRVEGLYGCPRYEGYSCPSSWSDGYVGWTSVSGSWTGRGSKLTLQPEGPAEIKGTQKKADPIELQATLGKTLTVSGKIAARPIHGELAIEALYSAPHPATASDLDGTWTVTTKTDKEGFHARLDGTSLYVKDMVHTVIFDKKTGEFYEYRSDTTTRSKGKPAGHFLVGADATGKSEGIVVMDNVPLAWNARIVSVTKTKVVLDVGSDEDPSELTLERAP